MIRKHESTVSWQAAMLSIGMHGLLVFWMIVAVDWKAAHNTPQVMQAELWDALPDNNLPATELSEPMSEPEPTPPEPPVLEKPIEPPPPPPVVEETQQDDIALKREAEQKQEKEKQEKEKQEKLKAEQLKAEQIKAEKAKAEKAKSEEAKKQALIKQMRDEELGAKRAAALKALQGEIEGEKTGSNAPANNAELNAYTEKLKAKIRGNVNQALCPDGNPELKFDLRLLPTGEISGAPKLTKSSGDGTCDDAVARAILASEPFAMPSDQATRDKMLNLKLKFKPHD